MDLLEAEGLNDLINAETSQQRLQASRQMEGELSVFYDSLRKRIIEVLAFLEAYIDFPDEDIPEDIVQNLNVTIRQINADIAKALDDNKCAERVRTGLSITLLGAPNAGKSSLMNALAKRDVAIVSHRPGTTRDILECQMDIGGYPVTLFDTAGLRESQDEIEIEGVKRALRSGKAADINLILIDGLQAHKQLIDQSGLINDRAIIVINKIDAISLDNADFSLEKSHCLISAKYNNGLDLLKKIILHKIEQLFSNHLSSFITRDRHRLALVACGYHLESALMAILMELKCEELRLASVQIGNITGKIYADDVLEVIFSHFCIGK